MSYLAIVMDHFCDSRSDSEVIIEKWSEEFVEQWCVQKYYTLFSTNLANPFIPLYPWAKQFIMRPTQLTQTYTLCAYSHVRWHIFTLICKQLLLHVQAWQFCSEQCVINKMNLWNSRYDIMCSRRNTLKTNDGRSNPKSAMPIPDPKNMRSVRSSADSDARMFF